MSTTGRARRGRPGPAHQGRPVRHPGRWVAAAALCVVVAMIVHTLLSKIPSQTGPGMQWRFGWGEVAPADLLGALRRGRGDDDLADGRRDVRRHRRRPARRHDAAVAEPAALGSRRGSSPGSSAGPRCSCRSSSGTTSLSSTRHLSIGIPFGHEFWQLDPNTVITGFIAAAILGLGLNEAAYMSEIYRAGIISVDQGQVEAAQSLGMRRRSRCDASCSPRRCASSSRRRATR